MSDSEASYAVDDGRLSWDWTDATGTVNADCGVSKPDGPYPAMVNVDIEAGSLLTDDVRELALALIRLAEDADRSNALHFQADPVSVPTTEKGKP